MNPLLGSFIFPIFHFFIIFLLISQISTNETCGVNYPSASSEKGVDGRFPWLVAIQYQGFWLAGDAWTTICSGTILNKFWVISSATCFMEDHNPDAYQIVAGISDKGLPIGLTISAAEINYSPKFSILPDGEVKNDLALILLKKELDMNSPYKINTICLPEIGVTYSGSVTVSGWGYISKPNTSSIYSVNLDLQPDCKQLGLDNQIFICTKETNGELPLDECHGDRGGPLQGRDPKTKKVSILGVATVLKLSSKERHYCGAATSPAAYTRIATHFDWISSIIKEASSELNQFSNVGRSDRGSDYVSFGNDDVIVDEYYDEPYLYQDEDGDYTEPEVMPYIRRIQDDDYKEELPPGVDPNDEYHDLPELPDDWVASKNESNSKGGNSNYASHVRLSTNANEESQSYDYGSNFFQQSMDKFSDNPSEDQIFYDEYEYYDDDFPPDDSRQDFTDKKF